MNYLREPARLPFFMNEDFSQFPKGKKIYLASDFHLGAPNDVDSRQRELKIVRWLNSIQENAAAIILAGDIFDFWFEYKTVVPKGSIRLLGKLAELADSGIPIIIFSGNHDLWLEDYLHQELGATIHHHPVSFQIGKHKIRIGHGDGLGPGDRKFKLVKRVFNSKINKILFRWLHPDIGVWVANKWSKKSRVNNILKPDPFLGEKEALFQYCQSWEAKDHHDYYIFGHRHMQLEMPISENSMYINLGDWITYDSYVEITNDTVKVRKFEN